MEKTIEMIIESSVVQVITAFGISLTYFIRYLKVSSVEMFFTPLYKRIGIYLSLTAMLSFAFTLFFHFQDDSDVSFDKHLLLGILLAAFLVVASLISQKLVLKSSGIKYKPVIFDNNQNSCEHVWKFLNTEIGGDKFLFQNKYNNHIEYRYVNKESCRIYEIETFMHRIPKMIYLNHFTFWTFLISKILLVYIFTCFLIEEKNIIGILLTLLLLLIFFSSIIIMLLEYITILIRHKNKK